MEHILQFGISIDEQLIVDKAINMASKKVVDSVQEEIDRYTRKHYGASELDLMFKTEVRNVVQENKDEIIAKAAEQLANNMLKSKAVREKIQEMILDD